MGTATTTQITVRASTLPTAALRVAVVIPCFRTRKHILGVIDSIGPEVHQIFVVDDCCPEQTGELVKTSCTDPRVVVVRLEQNRGVGGAVMTGYQAALTAGADIVVKVDGDGQMDPALLPRFIRPIVEGRADYAKGNRFFAPEALASMPAIRLFGNSVLSFVSKVASGYWDVMDPTNGYTAIHRAALELLPFGKIDNRYFFESDMLFRLSTIRAVVVDVPMVARYADEESNLRIGRVAVEFPSKYLLRFWKRLVYSYVVREINAGSIQLLFGLLLSLFGVGYGGWQWYVAFHGKPAAAGIIMLAALPVILGFQSLLAGLTFDVANTPRTPLQWTTISPAPTPVPGRTPEKKS
jgi:dolichol-phosphate mannosyltransferase